MKKYMFYSTLSFTFVFFLIEMIMSGHADFITFAGFNWMIQTEVLSLSHTLTWLLQGAALSMAAYVYMNPDDGLAGGFRFGLITGLLFTLMVLFNMIWQVQHISYGFFADSLLSLSGLYVLGFALSGWLFGLMFEIFTPEFNDMKKLWSLA